MATLDNHQPVSSKNTKEIQWTKVGSRKQRKDKITECYDLKTKPVKHYWNGFNKHGEERWYIELNNGIILSDNSKDYEFWIKSFYSNLPLHI